MSARLLLATRSPHKAREIRDILAGADIRLLTPEEVGLSPMPEEEAVELFDTFRANALAKARFFAERAGMPALADDSGLEVDALGGGPGVRTKRFSGREDLHGRELDEANNDLLLERLDGLPDPRRGARYVCAAAALLSGAPPLVALGTCPGRIAPERRGSGGFGYDPLFEIPELGRTFGELDPAVKRRMSHRARAFRALAHSLAAFAA